MAASIWSAPAGQLWDYPAEAFVRFCDNHGLLRFTNRPEWRTIDGGSTCYVKRLCEDFGNRIQQRCGARKITREDGRVGIIDAHGVLDHFDAVVIATHADEALALLAEPTVDEARLLSPFRYSQNRALLHGDALMMPKRRKVWSSWNYLGTRPLATANRPEAKPLCLTYWMNRLQPHLAHAPPLFVTLNPGMDPMPGTLHYETTYTHPIFNLGTLEAQQQLWQLQGRRDTWFCGAYFGAGFHEDALQSGLAVAEQLGGDSRPWTVANPSSRIWVDPQPRHTPAPQGAVYRGAV